MTYNIFHSSVAETGLKRCQVATPHNVVDFMWTLAHQARPEFNRVADFGAGDGRFALGGIFSEYVGVEIDGNGTSRPLPPHARLCSQDAFQYPERDFDLCIGNPPYVKASHLDKTWRATAHRIVGEAGISLAHNANLFLLFLSLALARTHENGLVVQLIPFEWVTRPSAKGLRQFLSQRRWQVSLYRFDHAPFHRVLTTASIVVIDKSCTADSWQYFDVLDDFTPFPSAGPSVGQKQVIEYVTRNQSTNSYCQRGLSPGGQKIFTLTEAERVLHGLQRDIDVTPCVTTLRQWPGGQSSLTEYAFDKHFIQRDRRCWLLKACDPKPSQRVINYLETIPETDWSRYSTCTTRTPWWHFPAPHIPQALVASGFRGSAPKIVKNNVKAVPVGSVHGIYAPLRGKSLSDFLASLRKINYRDGLVSQAKGFTKVEVTQMNGIIKSVLGCNAYD